MFRFVLKWILHGGLFTKYSKEWDERLSKAWRENKDNLVPNFSQGDIYTQRIGEELVWVTGTLLSKFCYDYNEYCRVFGDRSCPRPSLKLMYEIHQWREKEQDSYNRKYRSWMFKD